MENEPLSSNGDRIPSAESMGKALYVDPTIQNYKDYFDHLRAYNAKVHRELSADASSKIQIDSHGICFATTGSDARLEKGPVSPIEILLLTKGLPDDYREIREEIGNYIEYNREGFHLDGIEVKFVGEDIMSYAQLGRDTPNPACFLSPNRILDASYIFGNGNLVKEAKEHAYLEFISEQGRHIREEIKGKIGVHKKVTFTGQQRYRGKDLVHFNTDAAIANYDPAENLQSFKQGPLRAVQFALVHGIIKLVQRGSLAFDTLYSLPLNTIDKLNALEVENKISISHEQVREIADHYKYFLWLYHKSQHSYRTQGLKSIGFDGNEVKQRAKGLTEICDANLLCSG